ncbi:uncharacterized protein LOC103514828 isoform X6 [Diaphorina citri]|uniref:Uncharacterized protein LOC103514828 isoform X6 n=1 Tax=Diaphorina citri TaxID=121845 RepID=A0A3Q0J4V1_DIACI|nr:uncharacterized protein LOC103514828 isoform X6 [Diaphorina citri]
MSLSLVVSCLAFLLSVNILALETTTGEASYESMIRDFVPILKKEFNPTYINFRPLILPEEQYIYDEWGTTCDEKNRATICRLIIVSEAFRNFSKDDRHAMVHEALRDEMLKREAGCAIDIHADTPEEWNDFRANNDFDEISGKPDLRLRAAKTTPVSVKDVKLRDKIYNYIAKHFSPTVLHVVDSKKMHPIDNDNPAFDVLIVSNHFNNLTITQRTMLMHDYLRDFINEGVQFRLHALQSPEEVWPDRFNEDGFEANRLIPVHNVREHLNVYKEYVPPPTHVVELNHLMANKLSIIDEAKRKIREEDLKLLREYDKKKKQTEVG